jgi:hypothetical protein
LHQRIEPEEFTLSISRTLCALKLTVVIVTMLGIAGCASFPLSRETPGASNDDAAIRSSSLDQPAISEASLFILPYSDQRSIYVYDSSYSRVGKITLDGNGGGGPIATDVVGNLYVARQNTREVRIYSAPSYTSYASIELPPKDLVGGIAVDENTGVFAVLECQCGGTGQKSAVYFFRHGETTPCRVFTDFPGAGVSAVFDKEGTLFFQAIDQDIVVASVTGECGSGTYREYSFKLPINPVSRYGISKDDNIIIQANGSDDDTNSPWVLYTYKHPVNGVFGKPIATTPMELYPPDGEEVYDASIADGTHIWGSQAGGTKGGTREFAYPQGGKSIRVVDVPPGEVAVFPPLVP